MNSEAENPDTSSTTSESTASGSKGTRPKTTEMIERFKRFYGYRFDTDVARKLDLSDGSAIGNWRRRDSIDLLLIAEYCPEINLDWLVWGRGTRTPPPVEERKDLPDNVLYLQEMGVPREQIIMIVNEALEKYLGGKKGMSAANTQEVPAEDSAHITDDDSSEDSPEAIDESPGQ